MKIKDGITEINRISNEIEWKLDLYDISYKKKHSYYSNSVYFDLENGNSIRISDHKHPNIYYRNNIVVPCLLHNIVWDDDFKVNQWIFTDENIDSIIKEATEKVIIEDKKSYMEQIGYTIIQRPAYCNSDILVNYNSTSRSCKNIDHAFKEFIKL